LSDSGGKESPETTKNITVRKIKLLNEGIIKSGQEGIEGLNADLLRLNQESLMGLVKLLRELAFNSSPKQNYDHDEVRRFQTRIDLPPLTNSRRRVCV
jgi:hypothetical protein